jgi:methylmalonyl-CoA/ethylmalonyl-CoA epimerase
VATGHLASIGQIAIPVRDLARAEQFYKDRLGLRHLFNAPPGLVFFDCGGIRLMLSRPEQPGDERRSSVVYFRVADIRVAHRTLQERGVQFVDGPHLIAAMDTYDLWMAFFHDSEGNTLAMMSEVARK